MWEVPLRVAVAGVEVLALGAAGRFLERPGARRCRCTPQLPGVVRALGRQI